MVESLFAGVSKGWMANVVDESKSFGEGNVQAQGGGCGTSDLGDFEGVGETAAGVVALRRAAREDLGLASQASKGLGMEDAGRIAGEGRSVRVGQFGKGALG